MPPTARDKLNGAHLNGSLILAGLGGLLAGSWFVFFLLLIAFIGIAITAGDIRFRPKR